MDLYARCGELESVKLQLDREIEKCNAKVLDIIEKCDSTINISTGTYEMQRRGTGT